MNLDGKITLLFYADDGFIGGTDHKNIQKALNIIKQNCKKFGLLLNAEKTESMIMIGHKPVHNISKEAYERMITGKGISYKEKNQLTITCVM